MNTKEKNLRCYLSVGPGCLSIIMRNDSAGEPVSIHVTLHLRANGKARGGRRGATVLHGREDTLAGIVWRPVPIAHRANNTVAVDGRKNEVAVAVKSDLVTAS